MVSARDGYAVTDVFHALFQVGKRVRRLARGAGLALVEGVLFPRVRRREVGHHYVRPGQHALFAAAGVERGQRRGRGQEYVRQKQADDGQQFAGHLHRTRRVSAQRRVAVGDEGADAHHLRLEAADEGEVAGDVRRRLPRRADHEAAAGLIPDGLEVGKAAHAVFKGHSRRVQRLVMRLRRRLVAQKIAVGPRVEQLLVALPAPFAHGERHCAVRPRRLQRPHDAAEPLVGKIRVFPALQHHRAEAHAVARLGAEKNFFLRQTVAAGPRVGAANAAVEAVVFAEIGKFDQPADVHVPPVDGLARRPRPGKEVGKHISVPAGEQREHVRIRQAALRRQPVNKALQRCHR